MKLPFVVLPMIAAVLMACSDQSKQAKDEPLKSVVEHEAVDEQLTEELNQKLMNVTKLIGVQQDSQLEAVNKENLEKLSDQDRQALIDLTILEGAEKIKEDTDKAVKDLEISIEE